MTVSVSVSVSMSVSMSMSVSVCLSVCLSLPPPKTFAASVPVSVASADGFATVADHTATFIAVPTAAATGVVAVVVLPPLLSLPSSLALLGPETIRVRMMHEHVGVAIERAMYMCTSVVPQYGLEWT